MLTHWLWGESAMKLLAITVTLCLLACAPVVATFETDDPVQQIEGLRADQTLENTKIVTGPFYLAKKDYLKIIVSNYVNGFKEFDTTVVTSGDSVSVSIFHDSDEEAQQRANQLANRFREKIPLMLKPYQWAENITVSVTVHDDPVVNKQE